MMWSTQQLMERTKTMEDAIKRTMMASMGAVTLLLIAGSAARAETVAPLSWSWGESQPGSATADQEESHEGKDGLTENRPIDKPSPKLE